MAHTLTTSAQWSAPRPLRLIRTALLAMLMRGLGPVSAFLLTLVLARTLGASATGAFYITTTLMTCCAIVARLGFDNALQRYAGGAAQRGDWATVKGVYRQACRITGGLGAVAAAVLVALAVPLDNGLLAGEHRALLTLVALAVLPFTWLGIQAAMLKAIGHPAWGGFIEVGALPLMTLALVAISMLHGPLSLYTLAGCYLAAAAASALLGTWLLLRRLPAGDEATPIDRHRLLGSCLPLTVIELFNYVILWSPLLLLGAFASSSEAGLYNVAHRLAAQLGLIALVFASISAPRFAACHQARKYNELQELAISHTRIMTLFSLLPAAVLLLCAEPILSLFGVEFTQAGGVLVILVIGQLINIATGPTGYLLSMSGHERILRNLLLVIAPITLALSVLLISAHGALGAAWAVCLSMVLQNLICCWQVKHRLGLPFMLLLAPVRARSTQ